MWDHFLPPPNSRSNPDCMVSIHSLKCSFCLHWEDTHHIQDQCKGRSMKQLQVQKRFLRSSRGWDGHWGDGGETGFRTKSAMWWDPQVPPRSSYGLKPYRPACYWLRCIKAEATGLSKKEGGAGDKTFTVRASGNDTTSLSRANPCVSNLTRSQPLWVSVIHYQNVPDPFHKENRHLKSRAFFKTNIYFANNVCNIFHFNSLHILIRSW